MNDDSQNDDTAVSAVANARICFTDSLSVPKTIGIGPIIITPAPLVCARLLVLERSIRSPATAMMIIPVTVSKKPTSYSVLISVGFQAPLKCRRIAGFNKPYRIICFRL